MYGDGITPGDRLQGFHERCSLSNYAKIIRIAAEDLIPRRRPEPGGPSGVLQ